MSSYVVGSALPSPVKIAKVSVENKGLRILKSPTSDKMKVISTAAFDGTNTGAFLAERQFQTQSSYAGALGSSVVQVDFDMTSVTSTDLVSFMTYDLEMTIQNNDGANPLLLLPAVYTINQLQCLIDGKAVITFTSPRQIEHRMLGSLPQREFETSYSLYGYPNADFATTGFTVAAGANQKFRVPMHHIIGFLKQLPAIQTVTSKVTFRFFFNTGIAYRFSTLGNSTSLTVTDMKMIITGHVMAPGASAVLDSAISEAGVIVPAIFPQSTTHTFGPVGANGNTSKFTLNQSGWLAQLAVDLYATQQVNAEDIIQDLTGYQQFTFYDANGQPLNVSSTYNYQMYALNSHIYGMSSPPVVLPRTVASGNAVGYSSAQYVDVGPNLPFCDEIVAILDDTKRFGSFNLKGPEQIQIQAPSTGYTNLNVQIFFDFLATVQQFPNGKLQFSTIS